MEQNFFDRIIIRWNRVGEVRVLAESYLFCVTVPLIFYLLPEWIMVSGGKIHREGLFDYGLGLGAILFAPIIETVFIFVPILEILRLFKIKPIWTILGFAMFFEGLHTQRGFFEHLILYPTMVSMTVLYITMRKKTFLHALLFTGAVHEFYNFTVVMASPMTYDKFFY
ncbi:MAG: hypothetical protein HN553_00755 [Opitutae bacterium]|jgi:hypothetical protein|nr:hypothetical protein [Opitutae bacterium]